MPFNELTPEEARVIIHKGTERAFTGEYTDNKKSGTYICRRCNAPLYHSKDKFDSHCGWPSFDDEIPGAVKQVPDADGHRIEIVCANCGGHLGHVFKGERFTAKNTRHCVNSISMKFIAEESGTQTKTERAIFASGCFWGTEYFLKHVKGVTATASGYIGGGKQNPTYADVCTGTTGHAEAVEVIFDPTIVTYEALAKIFFETHDPGQVDGQGPDIGNQYRSGIFYTSEDQKKTAENLIAQLRDKGYKVVTELTPASTFWKAEGYHQDYYNKGGGTPYCHRYISKF